jgi:NAD(P)-dependent dehydrogenase (short-subunit alcohol dehydrogenase family)
VARDRPEPDDAGVRPRQRRTSYGDGSHGITRMYTADGLPETVASNGATWTTSYNHRRLPTSEQLSKAALISFAKTLSAELVPRGVRVNVVSPGPVTTPIYGKLGLDAEALEATAAQIQSQIPLGRFGAPHEIAATVLHLAARESAFIVGTEIIVDGGMSQL